MDITVNSITTESNPLGYTASVTITANKLIILNKRKYEDFLLQRVKDNELPNMKLSYDMMGEPNELTITVYANILTKLLCVPSFQKIEKRPSRPFFSLSKGMRVKCPLGIAEGLTL